MRTHLLIIMLILGMYHSVHAAPDDKERAQIVQLLQKLRTANNDTLKMDIHLKLSEAYFSQNPTRAEDNAKLARILAINNVDRTRELKSLAYLIKYQYQHKKDLKKALSLLEEAKVIVPFNDDEQVITTLISHEAAVYKALKADEKAQNLYYKQLIRYEKEKDMLGISQVRLNLGEMALNRGDIDIAKKNFESAIEGFRKLDDKLGLWEALNGLAEISAKEYKFSRHLALCDEALALSKELDNDRLLGKTLMNLGKAHLSVSDTTKAIRAFESAFDIAATSSMTEVYVSSLLNLGLIYFDKNQDIQAAYYFEQANTQPKKLLSRTLIRDINLANYKYYESQGDTSKAYQYLLELQKVKDEMNEISQSESLIANQIRFETAQKEQENQRLRQRELENQLTIKSQRYQNYLLGTIAIITLLLLMLGWRIFKQNKKTNIVLEKEVKLRTKELQLSNNNLQESNKQLENKNVELERFAYIASHDLKSPLRNIISFLNLIERKIKGMEGQDKLNEYLSYATSNAHQMHALIQDVLEYSKANEKYDALDEQVDLNATVNQALENLKDQLNESKALILQEPLPTIKGNKILLTQVFQNLISNGIKYNDSKTPTIYLGCRQMENEPLTFFVKDNGIGVPKEYADQVFEMFKRLHTQEKYKGTGIGLALVKKVIYSLEGKIWLNSKENKGTTFFFQIKKSRIDDKFTPKPNSVEKKKYPKELIF